MADLPASAGYDTAALVRAVPDPYISAAVLHWGQLGLSHDPGAPSWAFDPDEATDDGMRGGSYG